MATATDPDGLPLIDPADALARAGGRAEVAAELFALLRRSLPQTAEELRAAGHRGDLDGVREAVHRLRGATLYCGVPRLRAWCTEVEQSCVDGHRRHVARALPALLACIEAVAEHDDPLDAVAGTDR